jgi:hypothetical protein
MMKWVRVLLYAQLVFTVSCAVLTLLVLKKQAEIGWRFDRLLEVFFGYPVVAGLYLACQLSCICFPANVAVVAVGRISPGRCALAVTASVVLALFQSLTLLIVYPVRD